MTRFPVRTRLVWRLQRVITALTLASILAGTLGHALPATASPSSPTSSRAYELMAKYAAGTIQTSSEFDELDGFKTAPITEGMDPADVMRGRPFVVGENALTKGFADSGLRLDRLDTVEEEGALAALVSFLQRRGVSQEGIDAATEDFKDRRVKKIVPSPNLRAALLMTTDWDPYEAVKDSILGGKNPSGKPFVTVGFESIGDGAIATMYEDETGLGSIFFDSSYDREEPEILFCTLVHEALHGGGGNSAEEEIAANLLDTVCWAEVLLVAPEMALLATDLGYFNNLTLLGMFNSFGRAGSGQVGVATSTIGDIFVGNGWELLDAESSRAMIEQEWFYDALRNIGSPGQETTGALVSRFPGAKALGKTPRYDEALIAVIDGGVSKVITPEVVLKLSVLLGLDMTTSFSEGKPKDKLSSDPDAAVAARPLMPEDRKFFSNTGTKKNGKSLSEQDGKEALKSALNARSADQTTIDAMLAKYDDEAVIELISDPSLRAATLLLGDWKPWDAVHSVIFDGTGIDGVPLHVMFAPMRDSAPAARQTDWDGDGTIPAILVNSLLIGNSPELLASVIVEAVFLHDDTLLKEEAIAAATFGALAWADLVTVNPKVAQARTWGVVSRNNYLLALLNTSGQDGLIGILADNPEIEDVLPGVYADPTTFAGYIDSQPWGLRFDRNSELEAPAVFAEMLTGVGIEPSTGVGGVVAYGEETLIDLDAAVSRMMTPEKVLAVAKALGLGIA